jgi:hypothetical protein
MINSYVASGDLAPTVYFNNGPAYNPYNAARWTFYSPGYYPTFEIDGLIEYVGFSIPTMQGYINSRLAVPSSLAITQSFVGDSYGGTVTYSLTAEQSLGSTGELELWTAILEDHQIASSGYGYYAGQELMWEPRAWPCGTTGQVVSFTGPYPQTVNVIRTYTLNPAEMDFGNLDAFACVQMSTGTLEVMNASFIDLPDSNTGVYEDGTIPVTGSAVLLIGPNPACCEMTVTSILPSGVTGTLSVYGIDGRMAGSFEAGGSVSFDPGEPGVYLARLETSSGEVVIRSCTVL